MMLALPSMKVLRRSRAPGRTRYKTQVRSAPGTRRWGASRGNRVGRVPLRLIACGLRHRCARVAKTALRMWLGTASPIAMPVTTNAATVPFDAAAVSRAGDALLVS